MSERWSWTHRPRLWTALLVALGLSLRSIHYVRDPAVWHDEAALIVNVLGKGFAELLGPLYFAEAAPPLFLWLEKAVSLVLGDSSRALRLVPFLASCLAMVLMVPVIRRVLTAAAAPWALLLFAVSETLAWHACEAKPYAVDVLAAVLVLVLFVRGQSWPLPVQLALFAVLAAPLIFLCFPASFLYGGVLVVLLPDVHRARRTVHWLLYGLLTVVVFASFSLLVLGPVRAQRCELMTIDWVSKFPPWDRPWTVPGWLALSTVEVCRYCCKPLGQFLALPALVGAVALWGEGQRRLVFLLIVPVALALVAACMAAYPYGGSRVMIYAAPAVVLLIAAGTPPTLAWLRPRTYLGTAALLVLLVAPLSVALFRTVVPWERADAERAADYVLVERRPTEAVIANDWEYVYYFRHLGTAFRLAVAEPFVPGCSLIASGEGRYQLQTSSEPTPANRCWVIAKAPSAGQRQAYLDRVSWDEWRLIEQREFCRITVLRIERK